MNHIKIYEDYFDDKPKIQYAIEKPKELNPLIQYASDNNISIYQLIDNIANKCDVKVDSLLAHGSNGYALNLTNGNVMKITHDEKEVINAYNAKKLNLKHFVKVYNVYYFFLAGMPFYIIIMEKLTPLTKKDAGIIDSYVVNMNNDKDTQKIVKDYLQLVEEFDKNNMIRFDLYSLNMGYDKNGILKAFDMGYYSKYDSDIDIEQIYI